MAKAKTPLERMREICRSIPDTTEGNHFGAIAFKSGGRMYATFRDQGDDAQVVFALEPEHADWRVENDPRFERYPRAPHTLIVQCSDLKDWSELRRLIQESYQTVVASKPPRRPSRRKSAAGRRRR